MCVRYLCHSLMASRCISTYVVRIEDEVRDDWVSEKIRLLLSKWRQFSKILCKFRVDVDINLSIFTIFLLALNKKIYLSFYDGKGSSMPMRLMVGLCWFSWGHNYFIRVFRWSCLVINIFGGRLFHHTLSLLPVHF